MVPSEEIIISQDPPAALIRHHCRRTPDKGTSKQAFVEWWTYDTASPHAWGKSPLHLLCVFKKSTVVTTESKEKVEKMNRVSHIFYFKQSLIFTNRKNPFF